MKLWLFSLGLLATGFTVLAQTDEERTPEYWNNVATEELNRATGRRFIENPAKNIVFFLGDGMGITTTFAARVLKGQLMNKPGEETLLSFEEFPNVGLSRTYSIDRQTTDSAATATAYLSGVKNNFGTLGVDGRVKRDNCSAAKLYPVNSILHWAMDAGKSAGIVTTTRVTHATPAATYAHSADRGWEGDSDMTSVEGGCLDIAQQLVDNNPDIQVILGGGRRFFRPWSAIDPETGDDYSSYGRRDGRDLISDWISDKQNRSKTYSYVWNETAFNEVDHDNTDFLLGLFGDSHMQYEIDRRDGQVGDEAGEPSLAQMVTKAIKILEKNENGFFLLVEGGRIDHGHHGNRAARALYDTIALEEAVARATNLTSVEDTLTIATADHSHVFSVSGYPSRGNPILGKSGSNGKDGRPYTTLLYANGPGHEVVDHGTEWGRPDITDVDTGDRLYRQQSAVPLSSETHGGEDVGIYAQGPMAHLFHGVHQQNYIAHVMAYASCVGPYKNGGQCTRNPVTLPSTAYPCSASLFRGNLIAQFCLFIVALCLKTL